MNDLLLTYGPLGIMVLALGVDRLRLENRLIEQSNTHRTEQAAKDKTILDLTEKRIDELRKSTELAMEVRSLLHALVREDRA